MTGRWQSRVVRIAQGRVRQCKDSRFGCFDAFRVACLDRGSVLQRRAVPSQPLLLRWLEQEQLICARQSSALRARQLPRAAVSRRRDSSKSIGTRQRRARAGRRDGAAAWRAQRLCGQGGAPSTHVEDAGVRPSVRTRRRPQRQAARPRQSKLTSASAWLSSDGATACCESDSSPMVTLT